MNPPLNGFSTLLKSLWTWRPTAQRNERRKRKLLLGVEALEDRTLLTAYIVDTFDDTIASDGFISLREAIDAARTNTAVGDAPAGTVAQDTITFTAGLSGGTISLGGTQLSVGGDLLIAGLGANQLTIDAQTNSRVFGIIDSNTEISGLKLINGSTSGRGGAISSLRSELRLRNVEITASESTSDDGGAIYSRFGTLIVSSSTIWGNRAERAGAAITNDGGQLTILNSTLSKNESKLDGGALALYNFSATTIINSTITGNRADSDGNSTGAGGAILLVGGSDLELYNTISAGNFAGAGSVPNEFNVGGTIVASSNNLIGAASSSGGLTDGTDGNIVGINGTGTWDINAILDTNLMDNGGPTPTHLLVPGSPALNTGDNRHATEDGQISGMFLPADQRGESRFVGTVDMGAVEVQLPEVLVVSTLLDESDGDYSDGDLSLREAIEIANGRMGAESIAFRSDMVGTIALGGTQIQISDDVTITGPGADKLVIDAQADSRIFSVTGGIVELRGMKLSNGRVVGRGGAITSFNSNLTLRELEFTGSESTIDDGGAVYIRFGTAVVSNSTFSSNRAHRAGAALTNEGASLTIINSTFSGNESRLDGGALALYNFSTTTLINSTLTGNRADSDGNSTGAGGGLLLVTGSQLRLYNTIVAGNFMGTGNVAHDLNIQGTLVDSHHNLIGDADSAGGLTDGTDGNIVGVGGSGVRDINTILDTDLAANGGRTPTHLLVPGSPAFNAGDNTRATENGQVTGKPLTVDQRGGSRIRDLTVDIGAIEFSLPPETLTVSTLLDESDGDFSDGDLSLREAIEIANDRPGAEQITFRGDITGRILLGGTQLEVLDDVTIVGSGADILAIDGGGLSRIFNLANSPTVEMSALTLTNGSILSNSGGAIRNSGNLFLHEMFLTNNSAKFGGAIHHADGLDGTVLTILNSTIANNSAAGGGAIYSIDPLNIINSTISGNMATGDGGGVMVVRDAARFINVTITGNHSDTDDNNFGVGAGIFTANHVLATTEIHNSIIADNFFGPQNTTHQNLSGKNAENVSSHNIIGSVNNSGGFIHGENGNMVGDDGVGTIDINTILNTTLADNGGPTPTHALVVNSPAIDAGNTVKAVDANGDTLLFDQRGFRRVFDGDGDGKLRVDIGAVEAPPLEVTGGLVFDQSNGSFRLATVVGEAVNWFQTGSLGSQQRGFIGDFNGDGLLDGMAFNPANLRFNFFRNQGDGTLASPVSAGTLSSDYTWGNFMVGDFDGDGREEVMSQILSGPKGVGSMRSQNFNGTSQFYIRLATGYETFTAGDFNGDGIDDILGLFDNVDETRSNIIPIISISTPVGRRMTAILGSGQFGQSVATGGLHDLTVADFNGDGRDDIAVVSSSGQVLTASSTGTPRINAPDARNFIVSNTSPRFNPATYSNIIMAGNFDNDILADLFTIHDAGHLVTTSSTLTPNNLPVQTAAVDGTQSAGDKAIIGDFDGNGYDDVAVLGTNTVVFFSNGTTFNAGIDFGTVIGGPIGQIGAARTGRVL